MIGKQITCSCGWVFDSFQNINCPGCLSPFPPEFEPVTDQFPPEEPPSGPRIEPVSLPAFRGLDSRPGWDEIWMGLAEQLARRSTCKRLSVGCVIVSDDNTCVLGVGYNGGARNLSNDRCTGEVGNCGCCHSEVNALIKANYRDASKKKAYVTSEPCLTCAVALVNAGVEEVIYRDDYRKHDGVALLREAGVAVRKPA